MPNLTETNTFTAAITRIEANDIALGGNEINAPNLQLKQLTDRTRWLKGQVDALLAGLEGLTIGQEVQAWDADLDAIAALTGTGLIRRTGNGTAALVSPWVDLGICQGRLTLSSGAAIPTGDVAAATTVYFTPYNGNLIALYTGAEWQLRTFTERSLSLSGLAAGTNFDIFLYDNAGTLTLEATAWSNATVRATALVLQDGIWVRSTATTRRYLGTIRTTGTIGQCEDSETKRFVWNLQNQVPRIMRKFETTSTWTYSVATWRALNNSTANRVEWVTGLSIPTDLEYHAHSAIGAGISIGLDSTIAPDNNAVVLNPTNVTGSPNEAVTMYGFLKTLQIGYHYAQMLERGDGATATATFGATGFGGSYTGLQATFMA